MLWASLAALCSSSTKASLDINTQWRLSVKLKTDRAPNPVSLAANIAFEAEVDYEPPQGTIRILSCTPESALDKEQKARWSLSEDPDDRKDSLWIWGLFKEPLYPFLLFSLPTQELGLPEELDQIPGGRLYFQVSHRRDPSAGVLLGSGTVSYRLDQSLSADLVGLSDFTYREAISCGVCDFSRMAL